jgi:hypothetical protein
MAVSMQDAQNVPSLNTQEPSFEATEYPASINDDPKQPKWKVKVCPVGHMIKREVYYENQLWKECKEDWEPEEVIWPTWPGTPEAEHALASSPLDGLKDDWSKAGNRLRDSAKWMATVLGAGLAAVVGTSPLGALQEHKLHGWAIVLGAVGFVLLGFTLFLVL